MLSFFPLNFSPIRSRLGKVGKKFGYIVVKKIYYYFYYYNSIIIIITIIAQVVVDVCRVALVRCGKTDLEEELWKADDEEWMQMVCGGAGAGRINM